MPAGRKGISPNLEERGGSLPANRFRKKRYPIFPGLPVSYRKSRLLRRFRVLWGSFSLWRPRLIFWFGAFAIGIISVGFARLADLAQRGFAGVTASGQWGFLLPLIITPLGFMLSAYLAATFFPNAQGSGIPQAIAARHLRDAEDRTRLLSLRLVVGKILLTVLGLASGASIGREGPTVQVGASIMLAVARFGGMAQARGLILAGSAAGIAAAFNTPLAGIVFAIEEMSRTYESRANGLVLTAVILSGLAALGLAGSYNYFGSTAVAPASVGDWELVLICGIGGGALGAAFSGLALHLGQQVRRWAHPQPLPRMVMLAAACGLVVAAIGILSGGMTFGTGYDQAKGVVEGNPLPLLFFLEKLLAGFLSMMSGIPGGIFAPSLSVGRRLRQHDRPDHGQQHSACGYSRHGRIFLRRGAGTDDRLRHHSGNDRRPSGRHSDHGGIDDRLHHLAHPVARAALSRPVTRLHRRSDPSPARQGNG